MQKRKFSLQNFKGGRALSREEMKNVLGGVAAAPATQECFAHTADWSQQLNYSSQSAAHAAADAMASSTGDHWYYCCGSGCGGGGNTLPTVVV